MNADPWLRFMCHQIAYLVYNYLAYSLTWVFNLICAYLLRELDAVWERCKTASGFGVQQVISALFNFALGQAAAWSNSIWQPDLSLLKVNLKMDFGKIHPDIRNPFSVSAEDFLIACFI